MYLVILVESDDASDLEWLKEKCVPVVENEIAENLDRLDGADPEVSWEIVDKLAELRD
jgi:hypothetical protein